MNKQQLTTLEATLREGTTLHEEYTPCPLAKECPPSPYEYAIDWYGAIDQHPGQYLLDLTLWSDYYHYRATRDQPEEGGWATQESIAVWSPYLSELLQELEDRGIPLPYPASGALNRHADPLPSPTQQVNAAAIARGTG